MFLFGAGIGELIIVLVMLVGPLLKALFDYLGEQKRKQQEKLLKTTAKAVREKREKGETVLAEPAGVLYDAAVVDDFAREKKAPKIRSKSNRKKTVEEPVLPPVLAAVVEPPKPEPIAPATVVSGPQPIPLATEILKMFQSPAGVQQAVLVHEILKRPNF